MTRIDYYNDPNAPAPNSMVVATCAIIADPDDAILMVRRADNDLWALPGGAMELTETLTDSVIREVKEETGLDVEIGQLVGTYTDPTHVIAYPDGEVRREFSIVYTARIIAGTLHHDDESTDIRYVSQQDADLIPIGDSTRKRLNCYWLARGLSPTVRIIPYLG